MSIPGSRVAVFFSAAPFSRKHSVVDNGTRGQCPGNANSRRFDSFADIVRNHSGYSVWAKRRGNVVASRLHQPPVSMAGPTSLHRLERRISAYNRSLDLRASWGVCVLAGWMKSKKAPRWCRLRVALPPTVEFQ